MAQTNDIQRWARTLDEATRNRKPITPISIETGSDNVMFGYQVQTAWRELALSQGRRLIGHKIGLTSPEVQRQLGVDEPDSGTLFADMEIPDEGMIPLAHLIQPRIEAEIAFVLGRDFVHPDPTMAELIRSIDHVLPALEIVDSRIEDWKIRAIDTIADNGSSALFIMGTRPKLLGDVDLQLCGMTMTRNGRIVSIGVGAACLGHPLHALRWFLRHKAVLGEPLKAGEVVLSGALGPMIPLEGDSHYSTNIAHMGTVSCSTE
ncbi:2-keto-4-pentenoate hydratase [Gluconacetobacter diazotrophicus]|nr:fumarylacetoacetate hydrolase family protein [Gluconacetobacter diazotrophicus]